jgi:SOS-response transcriptional repressor LexA
VRCGPRTYVLRVQGHSMEPRFTEGELIFVDPDAEAHHGSFVVVRLDDAHQATFKQLVIEGGRRYLRPLNERWPDPIIEINGHATLCGVVVFQGRPV